MTVRLIARGVSPDLVRADEANTWEQKQTFANEIEVDGNLNHDGNAIGLFGQTPQLRPAGYNQTAFSEVTRAMQAAVTEVYNFGAIYSDAELENAISAIAVELNNVKRLLNQIIDDFQARGDFQ